MSRAKGNIAEDKACEYLQENGFEIVERNFYSRFGEIDIITYKDGVYRFIEVKSAQSFEEAVRNITPSKIVKLIKTIDVYLKKNAITSDYSLDAVILSAECIEYIEAITL